MGLTWEFTKRSNTTVFTDLMITLESGLFNTAIYAKPMALHLCIPPASSHAPGIATGLIFSHTLQLHQLCSHQQDVDNELLHFFQQLVDWGHSPAHILPLLKRTELNVREKVAQEREININDYNLNKDELNTNDQIFFHLSFHSSNPDSAVIQKNWRDNISKPFEKPELVDMKNQWGYKIAI